MRFLVEKEYNAMSKSFGSKMNFIIIYLVQ